MYIKPDAKNGQHYQKWNIKWSEANRDGADAESPFPLFFSFSASFKNSSPREKVGKLSSFWDWWAESLFVSIIVAKYIIFPRANNGRSREKKILAKRFAHAISVHYRDFEHAYVYWIWLRGSASYIISLFRLLLVACTCYVTIMIWESKNTKTKQKKKKKQKKTKWIHDKDELMDRKKDGTEIQKTMSREMF